MIDSKKKVDSGRKREALLNRMRVHLAEARSHAYCD